MTIAILEDGITKRKHKLLLLLRMGLGEELGKKKFRGQSSGIADKVLAQD